MVIIDIDWINEGFTFDSTGDIDTIAAPEAIGSYISLRVTEGIGPIRGGDPTQLTELQSDVATICQQLVAAGHINQFSPPRLQRDDESTITVTVSVDGDTIAIPVDTLST